jgi:predicted ester cyclase
MWYRRSPGLHHGRAQLTRSGIDRRLPMSEELKAKVGRVLEAWNVGNLDILDEIMAPNCVQHRPPYPDIVGLEALKKIITDVRAAYPDWHITGDETIVEGNTSAVRGTWGGTLTGVSPAARVAGAGKQVKVAYCSVIHWVNGRAVEEWVYNDYLGLQQQLGVAPTPE